MPHFQADSSATMRLLTVGERSAYPCHSGEENRQIGIHLWP